MPLPDETVIYHRPVDKLAQLPSQQAGLIIATPPQSFLVQWHRHQDLSRYRVGDEIVLQQFSQGHNQRSEISVL